MAAVATEVSAVIASASAQTLTLGIDESGQIRQHDRAAGDILADQSGSLLGTGLSTLISGPGDPAALLAGMIEATRADRQSTAVLTLRTANRSLVDAVVTVEPIRSADPELFAQVTMRIPAPAAERFIDPALMRNALLDGAVRRIGGALDIDQLAPELVNILVPHFCNSAGMLMLESLLGDGDDEDTTRGGNQFVRRLAIAFDDRDQGWSATFPIGEILRYPPNSIYTKCLDTSTPVSTVMTDEAATELANAWLRTPVAGLISGTSMLALPIKVGDNMLGFFICIRRQGFHRFDAYDTEIGMEFASRAALFVDGARRYSRERATALTLQRSMLPTGLSHPASVEVRHRYLPGSKLIEVGGDWYESIALPGGRVALVVGDVAGHGVRAAVTMGRLRTAIKTLTMLELPPAETLQRLDDLMHEIGVFEPHFATCVYAVYDSVDGTCEVASAGHLPPLLVRPDGTNEFLDVSAGAAARHRGQPDRQPHPADRRRHAARHVHRRPGRAPHRGHRPRPGTPEQGLRPRRHRAEPGRTLPRGPRRRLRRPPARRHRDPGRQAVADQPGPAHLLAAGLQAHRGQAGPLADPQSIAAVGPGRSDPAS